MNDRIIFRTFETYKRKYMYDRQTDTVSVLTDEEYQELKKVEEGKLEPENSTIVQKYQEQGLLLPNTVQEIQHPCTHILEHLANYRVRQLILQVTQQCNLRCKYCAYSGVYEGNRTHANKKMSFETAKKAIDFLLEHSLENSEVIIGFYGGEPLLEFRLIKECVKYVYEKCEGKKIVFSITTNATLLKDEIAKFIVENKFAVGISLDGSKKEHDISRKFPNGEGSFDIVMENLKNLQKQYPDYVNKYINIMTTVNPYMNLGCVLEFFSTDKFLKDKSIMFNNMVPTNLKEEVSYAESYFQVRNFEYVKALFYLVGKLEKKYVSQLMTSSIDKTMKLRRALHKRNSLGNVEHHGGPCMPGILRLFVRYDGSLFPCERVNEELEYYRIGTLDKGFDLQKMGELLNFGKITEKECKECWNFQRCLMCSNEIEMEGEKKPTKKNKLYVCQNKKVNTQFELYEQCVLAEFGYTVGKTGE